MKSTHAESAKADEDAVWSEFRKTGLFHFVNGFLHMFHWSLVLTVDNDGHCSCVPRKCSYSVFSAKSNTAAYENVWKLLTEENHKWHMANSSI